MKRKETIALPQALSKGAEKGESASLFITRSCTQSVLRRLHTEKRPPVPKKEEPRVVFFRQ